MKIWVIERSETKPKWLDVSNPSKTELDQVATDFGLHPQMVRDCLEPDHLPKFEVSGSTSFILLRVIDEKAAVDADNVRELTRKIAIFIKRDAVITVHRAKQKYLTDIIENSKTMQFSPSDPIQIVHSCITGVLRTFEGPIGKDIEYLEGIETEIFSSQPVKNRSRKTMEDLYYLRRRANVFRRILRQTSDILARITVPWDTDLALVSDLRDQCQASLFNAEQLWENVNELLSLHVSLTSHRTNEVVRVLTVFSAFFLPLTFIVGIYGMNFENMPELASPYGYPGVWIAMLATTTLIAFWFRKSGWLNK
jgi:magnesium transporter